MILLKNGDFTIEKDNITGLYAVFERMHYPSGTTSFWQQRSKWYYRKGNVLKAYDRISHDNVKDWVNTKKLKW